MQLGQLGRTQMLHLSNTNAVSWTVGSWGWDGGAGCTANEDGAAKDNGADSTANDGGSGYAASTSGSDCTANEDGAAKDNGADFAANTGGAGSAANEGEAADDSGAGFAANDEGAGCAANDRLSCCTTNDDVADWPTNDTNHESYGKSIDSNAKWTIVLVAIEFLSSCSTGSTADSSGCTTRWYQ